MTTTEVTQLLIGAAAMIAFVLAVVDMSLP